MEIKFELDTEKASKATIAITATHGLCQVSVDTEYPQLAAAKAIAIIIIIAFLYGPCLTSAIKKSSLMQAATAEAYYMAGATTKQQVLNRIAKLTLQTNKNRQYTHDAIRLLQKGIWHPPKPIQPQQPGQRHGEVPQHQ